MQSGLWGEVIKNLLICVPLNVITIVKWTNSLRKQKYEKFSSKKEDDDIIVRKLTKSEILKFFVLGLFIFAGCYTLLKYILPLIGIVQDKALILGALSLTISILGKILTSRQNMEAWILCISGAVICLLMWGESIITEGFDLSQISMIVYYIACLTNDIYAYSLWKSMYRKIAVNGGKILALRKVNIRRIIKLKRQFRSLHWDKRIDMEKNS